MSVPFWDLEGAEGPDYAPDPWDTCTLVGIQVPGIVSVKCAPKHRVDVKKAAGKDGGPTIERGLEAAKVQVEITIWTARQWDLLQNEVIPAIWRHAGKATSPLDVKGGKKQTAPIDPDLGKFLNTITPGGTTLASTSALASQADQSSLATLTSSLDARAATFAKQKAAAASALAAANARSSTDFFAKALLKNGVPIDCPACALFHITAIVLEQISAPMMKTPGVGVIQIDAVQYIAPNPGNKTKKVEGVKLNSKIQTPDLPWKNAPGPKPSLTDNRPQLFTPAAAAGPTAS